MQWFKVPPKIYFENDSIQYLQKMEGIERAFIVDDVNKLSFNEMVRTAMQLNLLKSDLAKWTEFREMRNLTSHTYDENVALKVSGIIPDFYEEITYLLKELKGIK